LEKSPSIGNPLCARGTLARKAGTNLARTTPKKPEIDAIIMTLPTHLPVHCIEQAVENT